MIVIRPGEDEVEAIQGIYDLVRFEPERLELRNGQLRGRRRLEFLNWLSSQVSHGLVVNRQECRSSL